MKDRQFGNIRWNVDFGYWEGAVQVERFGRMGQEPYVSGVHEGGNQGQCAVRIETAGGRQSPVAAQREAWRKFVEAMPVLGDEIMRAFWAEYQLQRPARVEWWKAVYGNAPYSDVLPEANSPEEMEKVVRPFLILLPAPGKGIPVTQVGIMFRCRWNADGCAALIDDGRLSVVDTAGRVMSRNLSSKQMHPTFGSLHRFREDELWVGTVQLEPFRGFCSVAQQREAYREAPERPRGSKLDWNFARGDFLLWVHARPGEGPSEAQARAWQAFRADETRNCRIVLQAIFEEYLRTFEQRRIVCKGREPYLEAALPEINSPEGLREIMELFEVDVLPDSGDARVMVSLVFSIAGGGVGVRWRNGEVVGIARKDGTAVEEYLRVRKR